VKISYEWKHESLNLLSMSIREGSALEWRVGCTVRARHEALAMESLCRKGEVVQTTL
jgi:hypothetical protein